MPNAVKTALDRIIAFALSLRVVRAVLLYSERRGPVLADSVTYRALFGIFAGVLLGFSLAAQWLVGNPEVWNALVKAVNDVVPGLVGEHGVISPKSLRSGLGVASVFSLVALVLAAVGAVASLRAAVRLLAGEPGEEGFFLWIMLRNLAVAAGIAVALAVSAGLTYFGTVGAEFLTESVLGFDHKSVVAHVTTRVVGALVVFVWDAAIIATVFLVLSGMRAPRRALVVGSLLGGLGLSILQQLSGLFVSGAKDNVLLASFASLIALLLWINLSAQVMLIACSYIIVAAEESTGLVPAQAARTLAERRLHRAAVRVHAASQEYLRAHGAVRAEAAATASNAGAPDAAAGYASGMSIARLQGGPLDGQILPLTSADSTSLIVPYGEGQLVYESAGDATHTGESDGPAETVFRFVEATEEIVPTDD